MSIPDKFLSCITAGAIGDAYGSAFENVKTVDEKSTFFVFGKPEFVAPKWTITDDTQLTLATCESIVENEGVFVERIADKFLEYYQRRKIRGIGASTLKAMRELEIGGHWSQVGRRGAFAAGNGAAMRIGPLAFFDIPNRTVQDVCRITHYNDEAYAGAMGIIVAIRSAVDGLWTGNENLLEIVIDQLPDTRLRDRLIELKGIKSIAEIATFGNDGYVVNSVPFAIAAANQVKTIGMETMYEQIIKTGGDTDTNASMAGQIAGAMLGMKGIPETYLSKLRAVSEYSWIEETMEKTAELLKDRNS